MRMLKIQYHEPLTHTGLITSLRAALVTRERTTFFLLFKKPIHRSTGWLSHRLLRIVPENGSSEHQRAQSVLEWPTQMQIRLLLFPLLRGNCTGNWGHSQPSLQAPAAASISIHSCAHCHWGQENKSSCWEVCFKLENTEGINQVYSWLGS